jgi:aspartyl protease family protein
VLEGGLNIALLGMSFLNRVEMQRDGHVMVLTRRY